MSYYSEIKQQGNIKTRLNYQKILAKWKKFKKEQSREKQEYLDQYTFILIREDDNFKFYEIQCVDTYNKHYADFELAQFISQIIADEIFFLIFLGEDNHVWGYQIAPKKVKWMSKHFIINIM